jgi:hypothetical protein
VAYKTLSSNIITDNNGVPYQLNYDPSNGYVQVIQVNAPSGTQPIFYNGTFSSNNPLTSGQQQTLYPQLQNDVRSAYNATGGSSKGSILQPWAQTQNQGKPAGVNNTTPPASVNGTSTANSNAGTSIQNLWSAITNPAEALRKYSTQGNAFGYPGEKIAGTLKYPQDLDMNNQDYLSITQYRYKAPNADQLAALDTNETAKSILLSGLTRNSDFSAGKENIMASVILPMPNSIADSNNVSWGSEGFNNISAALVAATANPGVAAALGLTAEALGSGAAIMAALTSAIATGSIGPDLAIQISEMLRSKAIKGVGLQVNPETVLQRGAGIIPNNNLELLFNSPTLRSFTFQYRMTARDETEASVIRKIIRSFKQGMAPKKLNSTSGAPSYFLGTPNIFRLSYKNGRNGNILGVNSFKTCALQSFGCNYSPDGFWAAYEGGQPVSVVMNMAFAELEPIYDTDYQSNNADQLRPDLAGVVDNNSVGY